MSPKSPKDDGGTILPEFRGTHPPISLPMGIVGMRARYFQEVRGTNPPDI